MFEWNSSYLHTNTRSMHAKFISIFIFGEFFLLLLLCMFQDRQSVGSVIMIVTHTHTHANTETTKHNGNNGTIWWHNSKYDDDDDDRFEFMMMMNSTLNLFFLVFNWLPLKKATLSLSLAHLIVYDKQSEFLAKTWNKILLLFILCNEMRSGKKTILHPLYLSVSYKG